MNLLAQGPADANSREISALTRQQSSIAGMEASLAKQRASVQRQSGQAASREFFVLSRPLNWGLMTPTSTDCAPLPAGDINSLIGKVAKAESVDPELLQGVMKQESGFRPCAVSSKGALGLMQLMPATARAFGVEDPFDPDQNVLAGAKLIKQLLARYNGDIGKALGAYNAGASKVDEADGVPGIPETAGYVRQILGALLSKN
jgi:soluble lytic murein transglycosylase-like protein